MCVYQFLPVRGSPCLSVQCFTRKKSVLTVEFCDVYLFVLRDDALILFPCLARFENSCDVMCIVFVGLWVCLEGLVSVSRFIPIVFVRIFSIF